MGGYGLKEIRFDNNGKAGRTEFADEIHYRKPSTHLRGYSSFADERNNHFIYLAASLLQHGKQMLQLHSPAEVESRPGIYSIVVA